MEWYASITVFQPSYELTLGLLMDGTPETSDKDQHIYIDHMALDSDLMFGTARRAVSVPSRSDIWIWSIGITHTD